MTLNAQTSAILTLTRECYPDSKSFEGRSDRAFRDLKNELAALRRPGDQVDHVIPQAQTEQFATQNIQNTANAISMPDRVHFEKTAIGNRAPLKGQPGYGQFETVREYTASLSWAEQRAAGFAEIRQAMDNLQARGTPISEFDRARVEAQIDLLTKDARMLPSGLPDFCKPGFQNTAPQALPEIPTPDQIQPLIDRHNQQSNARLPDARTVASWDGTTRSGTILDLGNGTIAQHQGQGAYAIAGIQQDLNGHTPPNGQYATLQQGGGVQIPQQSLGRTLA